MLKKYRIHIAIVLLTIVLFNVATLFLPPNFRGLSLYTLLFVFDALALAPFFHIFSSWGNRKKKIFLVAYWMPFTLLTLIVIAAIIVPLPDWIIGIKNPVATLFFALYLSHFLLWTFLGVTYLTYWLSKSKKATQVVLFFGFFGVAGLFGVSVAAPFLWTVSPQVVKVKIVSKDVPEAFSGYRIVQISDLHCDYFRNEKPLQRMVDSISRLNPDVIMITGDVVTFRSAELKRFFDVLQPMQAADGVYVVLGNHDYGSYYNRWKSDEEVIQNQEELFDYYRALQWHLLRNESVYLEKGGDTLVIAGVENQCTKPAHYPCKGDLHLALQGVPEHHPVILMAHNPLSWKNEISQAQRPILLTVSGHTHGMQIGYRTPSSQWSVWSVFNKIGMGLYEANGRYLYVNTGFGTTGFPFRIGLRPEITVLTLEKE